MSKAVCTWSTTIWSYRGISGDCHASPSFSSCWDYDSGDTRRCIGLPWL